LGARAPLGLVEHVAHRALAIGRERQQQPGSGCAYPPTFVAGTSGVADDDQGLASGLLNSAQELGGALGLAVLGSVAAGVAAGNTSAQQLADGYRTGYLVAAGLMVLAALIAWRAPRSLGLSATGEAADTVDMLDTGDRPGPPGRHGPVRAASSASP
jgi:MFS family permease